MKGVLVWCRWLGFVPFLVVLPGRVVTVGGGGGVASRSVDVGKRGG